MSKLNEENKVLQDQQKEHAKNLCGKKKVEIHVFCVVRPRKKDKKEAITCPDDNDQLVIFDPPSPNEIFRTSRFYFERVFNGLATISNVFDSAAPFVDSCLDGFNVFIFFYGSSGSGKSHLIRGDWGFIQSTAERIYNAVRWAPEAANWIFSFKASYWDFYKYDIIDLLSEEEEQKSHTVVTDFDCKGAHVTNLTHVEIKIEYEIRKILKLAKDNRKRFLEECVEDRPRVSSLFQLQILRNNLVTNEWKRGSVFLVELSANDLDQYRHAADWEDYMAEYSTQSIKPMHCYSKLMNFIEKNYATPSKTLVYATISPEEEHLKESLSTLQFVSRLSAVHKSDDVK